MARSRMIKPEFWSDEKLAKLCLPARLLYIGLWNTSDDAGATQGHPLWLKSQIFPYDQISAAQIRRWLQDLVNLGRIVPYTVKGEQYYFIPGFLKHQKIQHPSPARNPGPPREIRAKCTGGPLPAPERLMSDSRAAHEQTEAETKTETETETETQSETETGPAPTAQTLFERFWQAYPKKRSKGQAEKAWSRIAPDGQLLELMLAALRRAVCSLDWQKQGGKYIPYPATWLLAKGWEDETGPSAVAGPSGASSGPVRRPARPEKRKSDGTFAGPEALRSIFERHGVAAQQMNQGEGEEKHG